MIPEFGMRFRFPERKIYENFRDAVGTTTFIGQKSKEGFTDLDY